jgi:hypothetical protein
VWGSEGSETSKLIHLHEVAIIALFSCFKFDMVDGVQREINRVSDHRRG